MEFYRRKCFIDYRTHSRVRVLIFAAAKSTKNNYLLNWWFCTHIHIDDWSNFALDSVVRKWKQRLGVCTGPSYIECIYFWHSCVFMSRDVNIKWISNKFQLKWLIINRNRSTYCLSKCKYRIRGVCLCVNGCSQEAIEMSQWSFFCTSIFVPQKWNSDCAHMWNQFHADKIFKYSHLFNGFKSRRAAQKHTLNSVIHLHFCMNNGFRLLALLVFESTKDNTFAWVQQ